MIVRFRRINGNVAIPGESKAPGTSKPTAQNESPTKIQVNSPEVPPPSPDSSQDIVPVRQPDLSLVKEEPIEPDDDVIDVKPRLSDLDGSAMYTSTPESSFGEVRVKQEFPIKREVVPVTCKNEDDIEDEIEDEFDARNDNFLKFTGGKIVF